MRTTGNPAQCLAPWPPAAPAGKFRLELPPRTGASPVVRSHLLADRTLWTHELVKALKMKCGETPWSCGFSSWKPGGLPRAG